MSYGVDHRNSSDPSLLWMRHRPAAAAQIQHLAWELLYATGTALESKQPQINRAHGNREQTGSCLRWVVVGDEQNV